MGEILDFPQDRRNRDTTATGRFLLAVEAQQLAEEYRIAKGRPKRLKPTPEQSAIAKTELDFIFSGPNKKVAERMYYQGLDDVAHGRRVGVDYEKRFRKFHELTESMKIKMYGFAYIEEPERQYTPEALFYIHVETLTETANHAYDRLPEDR